MSVNILRRSHGFQLDHVALGVPDTHEGAAWVEAQTGATVHLRDPNPSLWYWSGVLPIGTDAFLEVIGPNPNWPKFQPFRAVLCELERPALLFWYIAVDDFDGFLALAKSHDIPIENRGDFNLDNANPDGSQFRRGLVGPGFTTARPNVISWKRAPQIPDTEAPACRLTDFELSDPKAGEMNMTFAKLGIDIPVTKGPSRIAVSLQTPNGDWHLENAGIDLAMPGMLWKMAGLWWRSRSR